MGRDMVELRPTHPGRQPINERVTITTEVLPNNEISEPHIKLPIQGVLHHKDELPEGRQGLHMGKPKGCGKLRCHSERNAHKVSRAPGSGQKWSFDRSLGQGPLLILESLPEAEGNWNSAWGYRCWQQGFLKAHPYENTDASRQHFGILAPAY